MAASTYPVSGTRAGGSAIVQETAAQTYAVATPAVLQENGSGTIVPPASTASARAMILA